MLSLDANLLSGEARLTNLHADILHTHLSLDVLNDTHKLADRCCAKLLGVAESIGNTDIVYGLLI